MRPRRSCPVATTRTRRVRRRARASAQEGAGPSFGPSVCVARAIVARYRHDRRISDAIRPHRGDLGAGGLAASSPLVEPNYAESNLARRDAWELAAMSGDVSRGEVEAAGGPPAPAGREGEKWNLGRALLLGPPVESNLWYGTLDPRKESPDRVRLDNYARAV
jgi:hypothetical protein